MRLRAANFSGCLRRLVGLNVADYDRTPLGCKASGSGGADAGCTSGNNSDFAVKPS
jgi:hypothetical protein